MPVDPSIALRVNAPFDPLESAGKALSLKSLLGQQQMQEMQLRQAQQQQEQEQVLNEAYRTNVGPGGQLDRGALLSSLAQRGMGSRIPGLQKQFGEADKAGLDVKNTQSQISERDFKLAKESLGVFQGMLSSLIQKPDLTHDDVIATATQYAQQFPQAREQAAQFVRSLPGDPRALRQQLVTMGLQALESGKRMEMLTPKVEFKQTGKQMVPVDTNAMTNPNPQALAMTTTPGEDQSAATARAGQAITMRGQNMVDARAREGTAAAMSKPFEVTGSDGSPVLVQQDKQGKIAPVEGYSPKGGTSKPLPPAVLKQITEARDNATTIDRLTGSFKPEYAGKGVLGFGADAQIGVSGNLGVDKDSVEWWKNYRKQAELIERHALFGAALTPSEQASWRSADIGPGMDSAVIERNLATRSELAKKVAENTRQDLVDAGHSEKRINAIAGRNAPKGPPVPVKSDSDYDSLPSGTRFLAPDGTTRVKP